MIYAFDHFVLDTAKRELRRSGVLQHVEPQVFDLLAWLIANRTRVVTRDELFKEVWEGRFVSDAALSTRLHEARRAIDDDGHSQRLIRTVHAHGLRFVGNVRETVPSRVEPDSVGRDRPTIAILPFTPRERRSTRQLPADTLAEEVAVQLSAHAWLTLAPPNSAPRYLLAGQVRQQRGSLRAIVRVLDRRTGCTQWAGRYVECTTEPFHAERSIAESIAADLGPRLYGLEAARVTASCVGDDDTWAATIRALSLMNLRGMAYVAEARAVMARAVRANPGCSSATSLLSFLTTLGVHMGWERSRPNVSLAIDLARRAALINPADPWAHVAAGYATIYRHAEDAIPHLQQALRLDSNLSMAHYFIALAQTYTGRCEDALRHADEAQRLAPFDLLARGNEGVYDNVRGTAAFVLGRYDEGVALARRALAHSANLAPAYRTLLINLALAGRRAEACEALLRLRRLVPGLSQDSISQANGVVWGCRSERQKYHDAFSIAGLQ